MTTRGNPEDNQQRQKGGSKVDKVKNSRKVDLPFIKYLIESKGLTPDDFCTALGISQASYYTRMRGESDFTWAEMCGMIELLDIQDPTAIFFKRVVD